MILTQASARIILAAAILISGGLSAQKGYAASLRVAVASNFQSTAKRLTAQYTVQTGNTIRFSFASTGTLYTQIAQGAPYDVFLAADTQRPQKAIEQGLALSSPSCTYAQGTLALVSSDPETKVTAQTLRNAPSGRLAIANPQTAPYGRAAKQALQALQLWQLWQPHLVRGNNIAQAYQFVATGNAELGLVAASQLPTNAKNHWLLPPALYDPILQGAVVISTSQQQEAAKAFVEFLCSRDAAKTIASQNYMIPQRP
ncbi:molybdate ABC transporter substrate-binding protein [Polycladidibacter hongkongensis]|uniref:molybdate ABC transporter substrate-binding protein n=1 Tax=Polycladidibacter hongkongensis TaxID=1647556 RepID=UPI001FCB7D1F|nr:molybdate ABC transporter substrate-binding protein [Pseudovibrio hongkongensis]